MAIVPFTEIDYLSIARDQVTQQFVDKDVFDRYLQLILDQNNSLQEVFKQLLQQRSIDEAVGAQLDIIGDIVGQPRVLLNTDLFKFFSFLGYPTGDSFGDLDDPSVGGLFFDVDGSLSGNTSLTDEQYRLFIKAKIFKNVTRATPDEFLRYLEFVFGTNINGIIAEGDAEFTVLVGKALSTFERTLLEYSSTNEYPSFFVPKPAGVRINYGQFDPDNYFGFIGAPGAKGFGDNPYTQGNFGYGDAYGQSYGSAGTFIQSLFYDGTATYNGEFIHSGTDEPAEVGGIFATLY